jgi:hypothetical protein
VRALGAAALMEQTDAYLVISWLWRINLVLPSICSRSSLDGGQILRSMVSLGQIRSLFIATGVGFVGGAALALFAFYKQSIWIGTAFFLSVRPDALAAGAVFKMKRPSNCAVPDDSRLPEESKCCRFALIGLSLHQDFGSGVSHFRIRPRIIAQRAKQ